MTSDFGGFGVVMQLVLGVGLIAVWNARQRSKIPAKVSPPAQQIDQRQTFEQLQTLLVNYPTVTKAAQAKPEMLAKHVTPLFTPLENLLDSWGYAAIGEPWAAVEFDPQLHQPDVADIEPGEAVYVRFVGYRYGEVIVCPAKVSRTLPAA